MSGRGTIFGTGEERLRRGGDAHKIFDESRGTKRFYASRMGSGAHFSGHKHVFAFVGRRPKANHTPKV
ncbi:hypothetical protein FRB99_008343 [Tulasnella sp. 403]|nr:hypothetical protein FRB99_008343 [Tulasnella sp. 403]